MGPVTLSPQGPAVVGGLLTRCCCCCCRGSAVIATFDDSGRRGFALIKNESYRNTLTALALIICIPQSSNVENLSRYILGYKAVLTSYLFVVSMSHTPWQRNKWSGAPLIGEFIL